MRTKEELLALIRPDSEKQIYYTCLTDCIGCKHCLACGGCTNCNSCEYCFCCEACSTCENCTNCKSCKFCEDCKNCEYCYSCSNQNGKKYMIENNQFTKEQCFAIISEL
jgi:hypothetical protein